MLVAVYTVGRSTDVAATAACGLLGGELHDVVALLSPLTVKTHLNRAMAKLSVRDRAQLVVLAYQSGLVRPDDQLSFGQGD